jgi:hypothetical protein
MMSRVNVHSCSKCSVAALRDLLLLTVLRIQRYPTDISVTVILCITDSINRVIDPASSGHSVDIKLEENTG